MKTKIINTSIALIALLIISCEKQNDCIDGRGPIVSRDFTTDQFSGIFIYGKADIFITESSTTSLLIEGEENVLQVLDIEQSGDDIHIGRDNCFRDTKTLKIRIATPELRELHLEGMCNATSDAVFSTSSFVTSLQGQCSLRMQLDALEVTAGIDGSGSIDLAGETRELIIDIRGDGSCLAGDLQVRDADIRIEGSGRVEVSASETLKALIRGSGRIFYHGNPRIEQKIEGSGELIRIQ